MSKALASGPIDRAAAIATARVAGHLILTSRYELADLLEKPIMRFADDPAARDPGVHARLMQLRANRALIAGNAAAHLELRLAAMRAFQEAGDVRNALMQSANVGSSYLDLGAWVEAERCVRQSLADAERMGLHGVALASKLNLGIVLCRRGMLDEGTRLEAEAAEAGRARGDARLEGASRVYLAGALVVAGDLAAAEREARAAVDLLVVSPAVQAHARAMVAHVLASAGRTAEARVEAEEALRMLHVIGGIEEGESFLRLVHAEVLRACGDAPGANAAIGAARDRVLARAAAIQDPSWRASFLERVPENARTLELAKAWIPVSP